MLKFGKSFHKYKDQLSVQDDLIFRNEKINIPFEIRKKMMEKVHITHNSIEATIMLAKDCVICVQNIQNRNNLYQ